MSSGAVLAGSMMSGGYAPAKAALWQLSKNLEFEAKSLGIKVSCLFPNLTSSTDLGQSATTFYAQVQGIDESTFLERIGSQDFSASHVAKSVISLITEPETYNNLSFRVTSQGLEPINQMITN